MQKTLVITGASRGIGNSTAAFFKEQGWSVVNISRSRCEVEGVDNVSLDLSQVERIEEAANDLDEKLEHSQQICFVHNAGYYISDSIDQQAPSELKKSLDINIVAPAILNRMVIPKMSAGSSIIYIGSTLSEKAFAHAASYVTSKHAVVGMMRATCQDLADFGVHTCCVCPGFTETDMMLKHLNHRNIPVEEIEKRVGANRLIKPKEIAEFIYFCANNPVVNGAVLHANLGQLEK